MIRNLLISEFPLTFYEKNRFITLNRFYLIILTPISHLKKEIIEIDFIFNFYSLTS